MPWPEDHKARTRERIVEAAAAAFRATGVAGVRLEDVMARAGLTHGGFYAHFSSKEDLLREALTHASYQTVSMLSLSSADTAAEDRLLAIVDAYLSPAHVAHPERGCPLATLGPEIARAGGTTHRSLADGVKARLAWMRKLQADGLRTAASDDRIVGALACMIGGVILARSVDGHQSKAVLSACRRFVRRGLGQSEPPRKRPKNGARKRRVRADSRRR